MKRTAILFSLGMFGLSVQALAADEPCPQGAFATDSRALASSSTSPPADTAARSTVDVGWPEEITRIQDGAIRWARGVNHAAHIQSWTAYDAGRRLFVHVEARALKTYVNPEFFKPGPGQTSRTEGEWTYITSSLPASQAQSRRFGCLGNTLLSSPPSRDPILRATDNLILTYRVVKNGKPLREDHREQRPFRWISLIMDEPIRRGRGEWLPPRVGRLTIDADDNIYMLVDMGTRPGPRIDVVRFSSSWLGRTVVLSGRTPMYDARNLVVDRKGNVLLPVFLLATLYELSPGMSVPDPVVERPLRLEQTGLFSTRVFLNDVAIDRSDNLFIMANSQIIRVTPAGAVTALAGKIKDQYADGVAEAAGIFPTSRMTVAADGTVFLVDPAYSTVRKVTADGVVTTLAGSPMQTGTHDGPGATARFKAPEGIAVDRQGTIYIADTGNDLIRRISPGGEVTTLAGTAGVPGHIDGKGSKAMLYHPNCLVVDSHGTLYVSNDHDNLIRKISADGRVRTWDVDKWIPKLSADDLL